MRLTKGPSRPVCASGRSQQWIPWEEQGKRVVTVLKAPPHTSPICDLVQPGNENALHYFFPVFLTLFEVLMLYVSSVAQLSTPVCYNMLEIKGVPMMPRNSREIESKSFSETRVALNRGIARPYLSSWRHLSVTLGNQISQSGTQTTKQVLSTGNPCGFLTDGNVGSCRPLA